MKRFILAHGLFVGVLLLLGNLSAMDPFYEPAKWAEYQDRVVRLREHEKLAFARPAPGTHPIVAMQTISLPEYKADNVTVSEAFDLLARECGKQGVSPTFYVDSATMRYEPRFSYEAKKGDSVARTLAFLLSLSRTYIRFSGSNILISRHDTLDPYIVLYGVYVLNEKQADYCGLAGFSSTSSPEKWVAAEPALIKQGIPFPPGTYADYRPDIHSLVVINSGITLKSMAAWLHEMGNRAVIESARDKGIVSMLDFQIETRSYPVSEATAQKMHAFLMDKKNKLVPFAHPTADLVSFRTTLEHDRPEFAAWLDVKSRRLWVRNKSKNLDEFEKGWDEWLAQMEIHPTSSGKTLSK